jgi:hypothetical protein
MPIEGISASSYRRFSRDTVLLVRTLDVFLPLIVLLENADSGAETV